MKKSTTGCFVERNGVKRFFNFFGYIWNMGRIVKKKFKTPLYGVGFTVIIYEEKEDLQKIFKNKGSVLEEYGLFEDVYDGWVFEVEEHLYCVFCVLDSPRFPTPGIIAHEAKHLVNSIFIKIHHTLSRHNDEPEAYLLGWIVNRIHELKSKFDKLEK